MERDPPLVAGNDELPTYGDLAAQQGPNSRFGRWKSWVEKRAAERYAEDTPERQLARRMKGWGPHADIQISDPPPSPPPPIPQWSQVRPLSRKLGRTQTVLSNSSPPESYLNSASSASYTTRGEALPPSHLQLHTFGSRFLPHSEIPILTLLPLFNDTKLLIGHKNGLSVLDLNPDAPLSELGSHEPRRRDIWLGEGVYQLALLEYEQHLANGTPQGVILALVGADPPEGGSEKDGKEPHKVIRMYNLASLASITSWATTADKAHEPLSLNRPSNWDSQQSGQKKHKQQQSVSRGLKLKPDNADAIARVVNPHDRELPPVPPPKDPPRFAPRDSPISPSPPRVEPNALNRPYSADSDWEMIGHDALPLRWAMDYVSLASPNSKLAMQSVLFFEVHRSLDRGRINARLAIVTKQNIFLYETVRGERAFRYVKEFYTPIPARSARFIYQGVQDVSTKMQHPISHLATCPLTSKGHSAASSRRSSAVELSASWSHTAVLGGGQLSLFLVFEKKAGLIRVVDSSVGEIDLWEDPGCSPKSTFRRSIGNLEVLTNKDGKGTWAPPAEIMVPLSTASNSRPLDTETTSVGIYFLTRGKRTHILPSPLPMPLVSQAPLKILKWRVQPTQVVPRVCERPVTAEPFLQVTALSEDGVEVQEFSLTFLSSSNGKEKARNDTVVAEAEVGALGAGFLCMGGHWSEVGRKSNPPLVSSMDSGKANERRTREQGFYAWTRKGYDDWRVFWLGGDSQDEVPPASP